MRAHARALLAAMVAVLLAPSFAFKADDFKASGMKIRAYQLLITNMSSPPHPPRALQKCKDSAFCTRMRGSSSRDFAVDPSTVTVSGSRLSARITNTRDANGTFTLALTAYAGIVRLHITEANVERYQVPDVLLPTVSGMETTWEVVKKSATKIRLRLAASDGSSGVTGPAAEATLVYSPVSLAVSANGKQLLTWNQDARFVFEHRRQKQEGDPEGWWAESFKTHHDSKPRGPESVAFDVKLHGFEHVYGLPEHASPLSLRATVGECSQLLLIPPFGLALMCCCLALTEH